MSAVTQARGALVLLGVQAFALVACAARSRPDPPPSHEDAVEACIDGVSASASADHSERALAVGRACAPIYSGRRCRDAFAHADAFPVESRLGDVARRCAADYCPLLGEAASSLCRSDYAAGSALEMAAAWSALHLAILVREIGERDAARLLEAAQHLAARSRPAASPTSDEPVIARVAREDDHLLVTFERGAGHAAATVRYTPDRDDAAALREAVAPFRGRPVLLRVAHDVHYLHVVVLMDALRRAGLDDVAFTSTVEPR